MTAQFLYDLRALTGFISGSDLHELFQKLTGDPSPSGIKPISITRAYVVCHALEMEMNREVGEILDLSLDYGTFKIPRQYWEEGKYVRLHSLTLSDAIAEGLVRISQTGISLSPD